MEKKRLLRKAKAKAKAKDKAKDKEREMRDERCKVLRLFLFITEDIEKQEHCA